MLSVSYNSSSVPSVRGRVGSIIPVAESLDSPSLFVSTVHRTSYVVHMQRVVLAERIAAGWQRSDARTEGREV